MLTDIFAYRYENRKIWAVLSAKEKRLINQTFRLIDEQIQPYYDTQGNVSAVGKAFWKDIHNRMATELGVKHLFQSWYSYQSTSNGKQTTVSGSWGDNAICENWAHADLATNQDADNFIKERLSLVEMAFRIKSDSLAKESSTLSRRIQQAKVSPQSTQALLKALEKDAVGLSVGDRRNNESFQASIEELNTFCLPTSFGGANPATILVGVNPSFSNQSKKVLTSPT